ncbi:MAG: hypothetical protein AAFX58_01440 [Pseudomonadota bacterium]
MNTSRIQTWTLVLLALSSPAAAAPYTLDKDLQPLVLELADHPDTPGARWAAAEGVLGGGPEYVAVGGLSSLSATDAVLLAFLPDTTVSMTLAKFTWDESLQSCATGEDGTCGLSFRAHDDVGFKLEGEPGSVWRLFLLSSAPAAVESVMASPLVEADPEDYREGSSGVSPVIWALLGAVFALAVVVVLLLRKRGGGAAACLLLAALSLVSLPQPAGAEGAGASTALGSLDEALSEARLEEARSEIARRVSEGESASRLRSRVTSFAGRIKKLLDTVEAIDEFSDAYFNLSECSRISTPAGMPRVPSFCAGNAGCQMCYAGARSKFDEVRGVFEQLRVIYQCTKNMTDKALAFGDSGTNVHAVVGLAWQTERGKIEKSVDKLKQAYDNKYRDLLGQLQGSMMEISSCEAQYGQPDWYDRFGYVYYEFMKDKYRRSSE